jgi:septum formation protein
MMEAAGLSFTCDAAHVDEGAVKDALLAEGAPVTGATEALAELKARRVGARHPGALVVGADSMLECEGRWYDKAATVAEARDQLLSLRGREHRLVTTAVLVRDGARLWHHTAVARLTMRPFSEAFLDGYLAAIGEGARSSVGCYQIEGRGLQLFAKIEGDFHAIVGLPMVALLEQLRVLGELET